MCDTSKVGNKYLIRGGAKSFSNLPFFAQGQKFKNTADYFVPNNILYSLDSNVEMPKGLIAKYVRSDGYGSYSIELKADNTYEFTDHSCELNRYEEGTWVRKNNMIILTSHKPATMLSCVTSNNTFYVEDDFLIGKQTKVNNNSSHRKAITEAYYYLAKYPVYRPLNRPVVNSGMAIGLSWNTLVASALQQLLVAYYL